MLIFPENCSPYPRSDSRRVPFACSHEKGVDVRLWLWCDTALKSVFRSKPDHRSGVWLNQSFVRQINALLGAGRPPLKDLKRRWRWCRSQIPNPSCRVEKLDVRRRRRLSQMPTQCADWLTDWRPGVGTESQPPSVKALAKVPDRAPSRWCRDDGPTSSRANMTSWFIATFGTLHHTAKVGEGGWCRWLIDVRNCYNPVFAENEWG